MDVETVTKIRTKYLQALEENDFEVLPGPTVVKGFLRSYAVFLKLDPELILAEYRSQYEYHGDEIGSLRTDMTQQRRSPTSAERKKKRTRRTQRGYVAAGVIAVLVVILLAWLGSGGGQAPATMDASNLPTSSLCRHLHDCRGRDNEHVVHRPAEYVDNRRRADHHGPERDHGPCRHPGELLAGGPRRQRERRRAVCGDIVGRRPADVPKREALLGHGRPPGISFDLCERHPLQSLRTDGRFSRNRDGCRARPAASSVAWVRARPADHGCTSTRSGAPRTRRTAGPSGGRSLGRA